MTASIRPSTAAHELCCQASCFQSWVGQRFIATCFGTTVTPATSGWLTQICTKTHVCVWICWAGCSVGALMNWTCCPNIARWSWTTQPRTTRTAPCWDWTCLITHFYFTLITFILIYFHIVSYFPFKFTVCDSVRKYWVKLVIMQIFESASLIFGAKGHTHNVLDGLGGHAVTRMSHECWDSPDDVVEIYNKSLQSCQLESGTFDKSAHKHDVAADWNAWLMAVPLQFNAITGPLAPHHFRVCRRYHLSSNDFANAKLTSCSETLQADSQDDVMLALYQYMSDPIPYQIVKLFSPMECRSLRASFTSQPAAGDFLRRNIKQTDRENVYRKATVAYEKHAISQKASSFLTTWASGTMRRRPRPTFYSHLHLTLLLNFKKFCCCCCCCCSCWVHFFAVTVVFSGFLKHNVKRLQSEIVKNPYQQLGPRPVNVSLLSQEGQPLPVEDEAAEQDSNECIVSDQRGDFLWEKNVKNCCMCLIWLSVNWFNWAHFMTKCCAWQVNLAKMVVGAKHFQLTPPTGKFQLTNDALFSVALTVHCQLFTIGWQLWCVRRICNQRKLSTSI